MASDWWEVEFEAVEIAWFSCTCFLELALFSLFEGTLAKPSTLLALEGGMYYSLFRRV